MRKDQSRQAPPQGVIREDDATAAESSVRLTTGPAADVSVPPMRNGTLTPGTHATRRRGAQGCAAEVRPAIHAAPAALPHGSAEALTDERTVSGTACGSANTWLRRLAPAALVAV